MVYIKTVINVKESEPGYKITMGRDSAGKWYVGVEDTRVKCDDFSEALAVYEDRVDNYVAALQSELS